MLGCASRAAALTSRRKRSAAPGSPTRAGLTTFSATGRLMMRSLILREVHGPALSFRKNGKAGPSLEQAPALGAQPAEHARLGDEDRVDRNPQLRGHRPGRNAFHDRALEGLPGGRRELRL